MPRRNAFTLVELLTVIGIIALLLGLLAPSLNKARLMAKSSACGANLHAIGVALASYVSTYNYYPGCCDSGKSGETSIVWAPRLRTFTHTEDVFNCPSETEDFYWTKATTVVTNKTPFCYGYNGWGVSDNDSDNYGMGAKSEIFVMDAKVPDLTIAVADSIPDSDKDPEIHFATEKYWPGDRHDGGSQVLFCDGHVKWFLQSDLAATANGMSAADKNARRSSWNHDGKPH